MKTTRFCYFSWSNPSQLPCDGRVTTLLGSRAGASSVAIQADGKIVVAGAAQVARLDRFALARYRPDGRLDATFGGDGKVTTAIGARSLIRDIALQSDGKILAAGRARAEVRDGGLGYRFAVARYNNHGSRDATFGGDGVETTAFSGFPAEAYGVAIQADRRIVVAGFAIINRRDRFAVARYRSTGSLDGTFGESGRRITRIGSSAFAHDVALQPDGKIVAVGDALIGGRDRFAVARYNSNGSRDATFSADGVVTTLIGSGAIAYGLALQADGNVLAAGSAAVSGSGRFAVARYIGV